MDFCKKTLKHANKGFMLGEWFKENECNPALTVAMYLVLSDKNEKTFSQTVKDYADKLYSIKDLHS